MDRRSFLAGTGAVLLATPLAAEPQQAGKKPRIGVLRGGAGSIPMAFARLRLERLALADLPVAN